MDGVLVVDKPVGPTSHDIVAYVRRVIREQRVGHTGTLDPMASGVLPLVIGRATRLARFLDVDNKEYETVVRLGWSTDTYDAKGRPTSERYQGSMPPREAIEDVLVRFRGTFLQQPPAFSAKKVAGRRSYRTARAHVRRSAQIAVQSQVEPPALPAAVQVTAHHIQIVSYSDDRLTLDVACSSGFYIRSLAHDIGQALGIGAHVDALRRTSACGMTLADAVPLAQIDRSASGFARVQGALVPMARMLPDLPSVVLTAAGARRAASGCDLWPPDMATHPAQSAGPPRERVKLVDTGGELIGIAERRATSGPLHPVVILM